jgi:hypothetical protein
MIQWEYKFETIDPLSPVPLDWFNNHGKDGWELCHVNDERGQFIFKRPKQQP